MMIGYAATGLVAVILLFGFSFVFEDELRGYLRLAALAAAALTGYLIYKRLHSGVPY